MTDEEILAHANELVAQRLDFETTHRDAGDSYAHLPAEGVWDYENTDTRLAEWCESQGVKTGNLEPDAIGRLALENFTMRPGHIFGPAGDTNESRWFIGPAFVVEEIEISLWEALQAEGVDWESFVRVLVSTNDCDAYVTGTGAAYVTTDCVWYVMVDRKTLEAAVLEVAP